MKDASKWPVQLQSLLRNPRRRTNLCVILTVLVPVIGWIPIELLWLGNLCFLWKEHPQCKIRFWYGFLIVLVSGLLLWNVITRMLLLSGAGNWG